MNAKLSVLLLCSAICTSGRSASADELMMRIVDVIDSHIKSNREQRFTRMGVPRYVSRSSDSRTLIATLKVIDPTVFDPSCIRMLQEVLKAHPGWKVQLVCDQTDDEPDLVVSADSISLSVDPVPNASLEELTKTWHERVAVLREPWSGPLFRQFDHCIPRVPALVKGLSKDDPVRLVAAFDNHEGRPGRTNLWILHLGGPTDIGLHGAGVKRPAHGVPDVRLDRTGSVTDSRTDTYATLVQWLIEDPPELIPMGPYVRIAPGQYEVREGKWSLKFDSKRVLSDADLKE